MLFANTCLSSASEICSRLGVSHENEMHVHMKVTEPILATIHVKEKKLLVNKDIVFVKQNDYFQYKNQTF